MAIATGDTMMRLDRLPGHLTILGSDVVTAEMAHIFSARGFHFTIGRPPPLPGHVGARERPLALPAQAHR
ncbi:hypothetical protein [Kitasatospora indigofera]|uniref:hypothetical protein n=1 Tax=Kitasatospora indigofera TaxID=67307 RepID=UPI0036994C4A